MEISGSSIGSRFIICEFESEIEYMFASELHTVQWQFSM